MRAQYNDGDIIKNMAPEKSEDWQWFDFYNLPGDLLLPLENLVKNNIYGMKNIEEKV